MEPQNPRLRPEIYKKCKMMALGRRKKKKCLVTSSQRCTLVSMRLLSYCPILNIVASWSRLGLLHLVPLFLDADDNADRLGSGNFHPSNGQEP
jgi:hypothetical protein